MKRRDLHLLASVVITVSGAVATSGCAVTAEGEVGSATQALAGSETSYWDDNNNGDNWWGVSMASPSTQTCFLSGVAGNLGKGDLWSHLQIGPSVWADGRSGVYVGNGNGISAGPVLYARGGFWWDGTFTHPEGNRVAGQATCVYFPSSASGSYDTGAQINGQAAKQIANYGTSTRQCFLTGLQSGAGTWANASSYARVVARPSGGFLNLPIWWLEVNLPHPNNNQWPTVSATCIDFPPGTNLTSGSVSTVAGETKTVPIAPPSSILDRTACGITGIEGALNVNSDSDGAVMLTPTDTADGSWKVVVKNGKKVSWACAQ